MPVSISSVPLVALALLAALTALATHSRLSRGARLHPFDYAWLLPAAAALVVTAVWCKGGLYVDGDDPLAVAILCTAALVEGVCALLRRPALDALDAAPGEDARSRARREALRGAIAVGALLASTVLAWVALELPWNPSVLAIEPTFSAIEIALVMAVLVLLYLVFQRRGAGIAVGVGAFGLLGVAQYFVAQFKDAAIMPGDLLALGTAAAVAGGYTYSVDHFVALGLSCALVAMGTCAFVAPSRPRTRRGLLGNVAGNVCAALVVGCLLWSGVTLDYGDAFGMSVDYWASLAYFRAHGLLPSFVRVAQDLPIARPEGYSDEGAEALEADYAAVYDETVGASARRQAAQRQFEELRPSVICIMDESFDDLSFMDGLGVGYEGPEFYHDWPDTVLRGSLAVSVQGGGTCNTEFEFFTGSALAYVGSGKYPYTIYSLAEAPSLPRQFAEMGYETTAIHPESGNNWNRRTVYQALGFDEFIDIEGFEGAERFHSGVSDGATFDKILEVLQESDEPQFIFGLTMQNHGSYSQGNIPADQLRGYAPEGLGAEAAVELNEYLACADATGRDLGRLVSELVALDRPVVLVFFGDHQPYITPELASLLYPDADNLTRGLMTFRATYAVWANYPIATGADDGAATQDDAAGDQGTAQGVWDDTSASFLGAMALDAIGAPLTDFQKAQIVARADIPAINILGTRLADGTWIAHDQTDAMPQAYDDLAQITYLEFARKVE